jgi:MoaA/NifB/PqqE/SkfB family radical SAM enzyme
VRAPRIVSITATSRCNLRCVMCDHGLRRVEKQDFDAALIDRIGDFYASADVVDLTGLGEPLLSDFFWATLDRNPARNGKGVFMFNTNGTLLTDRNIERILAADVRRLRVSIDSPDPATFSAIRGTELAPIVAGARKLVQRRTRQAPLIGIEMTVMRRNLHQVPAMIDLAKDIGVDFFEAWSVNEISGDTLKAWALPGFTYADELLSTLPREALKATVHGWSDHAAAIGMPAGFIILGDGVGTADYPHEDWSTAEPVAWQEDSIRCTLPWTELRTDYDGGVTACCWGPKKLGNLREETMAEIWNGPTMQTMRADLLAGRVPEPCKGAACQFINKRG